MVVPVVEPTLRERNDLPFPDYNQEAGFFGNRPSGSVTVSFGWSLPFQRQRATQVPPGDMNDG